MKYGHIEICLSANRKYYYVIHIQLLYVGIIFDSFAVSNLHIIHIYFQDFYDSLEISFILTIEN